MTDFDKAVEQSNTEWAKPSDERVEKLLHECLLTAVKAVAPIRNVDCSESEMKKAILLAYAGVNETISRLDDAFKVENPDRNCHGHYIEVGHVVATAVAAISEFGDGAPLGVLHAYSVIGGRVLAFAGVVKALEAFQEAMHSINETGGSLFGANYAAELIPHVECAA